VSIEKMSLRGAQRSNLYYARSFPPAGPLVLEAVERGPGRHAAGAGIGVHGSQA